MKIGTLLAIGIAGYALYRTKQNPVTEVADEVAEDAGDVIDSAEDAEAAVAGMSGIRKAVALGHIYSSKPPGPRGDRWWRNSERRLRNPPIYA